MAGLGLAGLGWLAWPGCAAALAWVGPGVAWVRRWLAAAVRRGRTPAARGGACFVEAAGFRRVPSGLSIPFSSQCRGSETGVAPGPRAGGFRDQALARASRMAPSKRRMARRPLALAADQRDIGVQPVSIHDSSRRSDNEGRQGQELVDVAPHLRGGGAAVSSMTRSNAQQGASMPRQDRGIDSGQGAIAHVLISIHAAARTAESETYQRRGRCKAESTPLRRRRHSDSYPTSEPIYFDPHLCGGGDRPIKRPENTLPHSSIHAPA